MVLWVIFAFLLGTVVQYMFDKNVLRILKKANCHLCNECDMLQMVNKMMFKTLHHRQQDEVLSSDEYKQIRMQYEENKKSIHRTGKY